MQKKLLTILGLSATFFLIGCADDKARQEIADTNVKLSQMQQNVDLLGTKVSNQKLLDILNKLDDLQNQINEINGNVDTIKHEQKTSIATQEQLNQSLQQQLGNSAAAATTTTENKAQVVSEKVESPKEDNTSEELKSAMTNIKKRKFPEAKKQLKNVIKTSNNKTEVASATYYLAVTYAASGQYKSGIAAAKSFIEANPDNQNVPDALRTIYISQIQLGMTKSAKTTANQLIKQYPESHAAKKVQQEQKASK